MKKPVLIFAFFSVIASGLNYIVYPLLSRILPPSEYVDITVALSLFTQISTFLSSIIAITVGISKRDKERASHKISFLQGFLFKCFIVLAIVFLLLSPVLMPPLHIPVVFVIPICLMMLFSIPITIISGYLNGINSMPKLGLVALVSASNQFVVALVIASVTHNALLTMLSMTIAQLITIAVIYKAFSSMQLPPLEISSLLKRRNTKSSQAEKRLMVYTVGAALSIMAVSITQVADLLIIQRLTTVDIKFYTDIYVISRIVFFAGMIFIWPFLGQINLDTPRKNVRPYLSIVGFFILLGLVATTGLWIAGGTITNILFNTTYSLQQIREIGSLSTLFKVSMLIITASILYYIVLHRATAIYIALITSGSMILYAILIEISTEMMDVLKHINLIAGIIALVLFLLFLFEAFRKIPRT